MVIKVKDIDSSKLVKKFDYTTKITEIEYKIPDHQKGIISLKAKTNFNVKLKLAKLASKKDISDFMKNIDFDEKLKNINNNITSNKAKHGET